MAGAETNCGDLTAAVPGKGRSQQPATVQWGTGDPSLSAHLNIENVFFLLNAALSSPLGPPCVGPIGSDCLRGSFKYHCHFLSCAR